MRNIFCFQTLIFSLIKIKYKITQFLLFDQFNNIDIFFFIIKIVFFEKQFWYKRTLISLK